MNSSDLIKRILDDGWIKVGHKGSHAHFKHPIKKGRVTIPTPVKDLPTGTVRSILKQAELPE